jgi:ATP/maltotriose-dependent transcriptional regulator MalT
MQFGWAAIRTGDYAQAARHLEEFLVLAQEAGDITNIAFAHSGLGEVAVRQGQYEHAASLLERGLALNRERGDKWGTGTVLGSLGWVALRQRDFKRMKETLRESLLVRMEIGDRGGIAWCLEKLAEAASLQGQPQQAVRLFGGAAALRAPLRSVIDPADRPDYERTLTALRATLGDKMFEAAWAEGSALTMAQAVEAALSELALATVEEPAASSQADKEKFGGLTGRERQVAALIAQGQSNREIAEAMVVSIRTVETYVTRIFNKLGFDSRVQVATWAMEKGLTSSTTT